MADPVPIGEHWVLATVDDVSGGRVNLHVSITVQTADELNGADLAVAALADSQTLQQLSAPDPTAPLSTVATRAITAVAQYTFDNPAGLVPTHANVTLRGVSKTLELNVPSV